MGKWRACSRSRSPPPQCELGRWEPSGDESSEGSDSSTESSKSSDSSSSTAKFLWFYWCLVFLYNRVYLLGFKATMFSGSYCLFLGWLQTLPSRTWRRLKPRQLMKRRAGALLQRMGFAGIESNEFSVAAKKADALAKMSLDLRHFIFP